MADGCEFSRDTAQRQGDVFRLYVGQGRRISFAALADATGVPLSCLKGYAADASACLCGPTAAAVRADRRSHLVRAMRPEGLFCRRRPLRVPILQSQGNRSMTTASSLRRFAGVAPTGHGIAISALHPAHRSGRSIFPTRVYDPSEVGRVLKTGHQSRKIGKSVQKGPRRGWPIFTLTLEERATCPRTCKAWGWCFGNNMHAAERIVAGPELEAALWTELAALQGRHPGGFMVRLHVLGDFYSLDYVRFWTEALEAFPALHCFGFTARDPAGEIGQALFVLAAEQWERFAVRFSGMPGPLLASRIGAGDDPDAIVCPAQTGGADCCATCMLCIHSDRSIEFLRH